MGELDELRQRWAAALERRAQLQGDEDDWRRRYQAAVDFSKRDALVAEHAGADRPQRIREVNGGLAHLRVLIDLHLFELGQLPNYRNPCKPAFAMSCDEVLDKLDDWLVDLVTRDLGAVYLRDSQRLLLGWCAQILVGQAPHSEAPAYPEDFLDAARSIYAFALGDDVAKVYRGVIGRNQPDSVLLLAFASFPFLEGVVRRQLPDFMDEHGSVRQDFKVGHRPYVAGKPSPISNVAHALQLLERETPDTELRERLVGLRRLIDESGPSLETQQVSDDERDLFEIISKHRNSNLHGGHHVAHIGLAALLLATSIGISGVRDSYEHLSWIARMVARGQSPADPSQVWPHWIFYPVSFPISLGPEAVHCWEPWPMDGSQPR